VVEWLVAIRIRNPSTIVRESSRSSIETQKHIARRVGNIDLQVNDIHGQLNFEHGYMQLSHYGLRPLTLSPTYPPVAARIPVFPRCDYEEGQWLMGRPLKDQLGEKAEVEGCKRRCHD
jgi:hypothetical protein